MRKKAPARKKRKAPAARLGVCPGCGRRMGEVHDVMGDSWECRQCGHTEEMWPGRNG